MTDLIQNTIDYVKLTLQFAETGHDWFHIERVWKLAKKIHEREGGNLEIIELAALLHDIADTKFNDGDESEAFNLILAFLEGQGVSEKVIFEVLYIVQNISFKNLNDFPDEVTPELKIVQDADRLDAMGAIGIARTFNFGGWKNNVMYDPERPPQLNMIKKEYTKSNGTTINHFYEKLLLLKDLMNTETGMMMAQERHDFMLNFLDQFYKEWNCS